jgi:hypothetical protein
MASLRVHPDRLEIHLTPAERTLALRRENLVIKRDTIRSVTITDDPWTWVRGIRAPGAWLPLVLAIGVWKFHGGKDFLAIKRRRQAVVIDMIGGEFSRVILSTNHAPDLIASLKLDAAETEAAEAQAAEIQAAKAPAVDALVAAPVKPKRVRTPKPVQPATPAESTTPATSTKPGGAAKPARAAKPDTAVKRAATTKPSTAVKPPAAPKPSTAVKPPAAPKPAAASTTGKRTAPAASADPSGTTGSEIPADAAIPAAPVKRTRAPRAVPPVDPPAAATDS